MKLNYKKTIFVGFAFFLISLFWQAYDTIIPKILTDKFGMSQFWSGAIMAFDNILALFLLPLFGTLSDRHKGKRGRRTPFILIGTIIAAVAFVGLSFADNAQLSRLDKISAVVDSDSEGYAEAMGNLYDSDVEITVDGKTARLSELFESREDFVALSDEDEDYAKYVTPARQAYAADTVNASPSALILFISLLMVVLLSMATFRSPAVALMPDVTPKPLRSKANAIINLMGTFGGIIVLIMGIVFGTGKPQNSLMNYVPFFGVVACLMIAALVVFLLRVNEPRLVREMHEESRLHGIEEDGEEEQISSGKLSRDKMISLIFILASVVFWFMGYNAVTSKYSVYAGEVLRLDYNLTLILAQAAAVVAYIPVGIVASKIGRKKTILAGVLFLASAFFLASFMKAGCNIWLANFIFILAGVGWATINVNSYPMVVELSSSGNVGKYTGFYYTASMAAQTVTPMLSGFFLDNVGMRTLFPYATVFVCLAFVTMLFVRHGDSRPIPAKNKLDAFDVD